MIAQATLLGFANPWRSEQRFRYGWPALVSAVVHGIAGALVMGVIVRAPSSAPPIRVLLYDPPPPPAAAANAAVQPVPSAPQVITAPRPEAQPVQEVRKPVIRRRKFPPPAPAPAPADALQPQTSVAASGSGAMQGGAEGGVVGGRVGGTGRTLLSADQAAHLPVPIAKVQPEYPPIARLRGIEGQVVLEAIVAADGRIEPDIMVVQSVPMLDGAAVSAVRQWRFQPARDATGEPLRVTLRVPVRFVLR